MSLLCYRRIDCPLSSISYCKAVLIEKRKKEHSRAEGHPPGGQLARQPGRLWLTGSSFPCKAQFWPVEAPYPPPHHHHRRCRQAAMQVGPNTKARVLWDRLLCRNSRAASQHILWECPKSKLLSTTQPGAPWSKVSEIKPGSLSAMTCHLPSFCDQKAHASGRQSANRVLINSY